MEPLTNYYVRTRQWGASFGESPWSQASRFISAPSTLAGIEVKKGYAPNISPGDNLGFAVAISKDGMIAAICAPYSDTNGTNNGSVYIWEKVNNVWTYRTELTPVSPTAGERFGSSVALNGDGTVIAVGSYLNDSLGTDSGAVYVFTRSETTWTHRNTLKLTFDTTMKFFGYAVSLDDSGLLLAAGAYTTRASPYYGAVFVYQSQPDANNWLFQAKVFSSDRSASDYFGGSVALSGDGLYLVVGAYRDNDIITAGGSAYVFLQVSPTEWVQQVKLVPPVSSNTGYYGYAVTIDRDAHRLAVSELQSNKEGRVYLYKRSEITWTLDQTIDRPDVTSDDYFGNSLALSNDSRVLLIGAYGDDDKASAAGAAYVYLDVLGTLEYNRKLKASDGQKSDYFGIAVTISEYGNNAVIGALYDDDKGSQAGAAYFFT